MSDLRENDWNEEYYAMINDCEEQESKLTDWERSFIDSITARLDTGIVLTGKQIEKLESIWEKATK